MRGTTRGTVTGADGNWSRAWALAGLVAALAVGGCASTSTQKVKVEEPDFRVLEAAPGGREAWLDNPRLYAEESKLDLAKSYFYRGEAASADKRLACEKAHANALDDIARQVAVFTDTTISRAAAESSTSSTSQATPELRASEEVQRISAQLAKTQLTNIELLKSYWERRDYSQGGGARSIFQCWTLVSAAKQDVQSMVARASSLKLQSDPALKEKVDAKIGNIGQEYENWQKSH